MHRLEDASKPKAEPSSSKKCKLKEVKEVKCMEARVKASIFFQMISII